MNRYEFAMLTAKAIDKFDQANDQQKETINKLSAEFANELNHMGARVAKVEAKTNSWVVGGDFRTRYLMDKPKYPGGSGDLKGSERFDMRTRIGINGTIANNFLMQARLVSEYGNKYGEYDSPYGSTVYFDMMNVTGKNILGLDKIRVGRSAFDVLGNGLIGRPNCSDGLGIWKTVGALQFNAWTGDVKDNTGTTSPSQITTAQLTYRPNNNFKAGLGYYWADFGGSGNLAGTGTMETSGGSFSSSRGMDLSANVHAGKLWLMGDYIFTNLSNAVGLPSNPRGWVVQLSNGVGPGAKAVYYPATLLVDKDKKGNSAWAISYRSVAAGTIPSGVGGFDDTAVGRPSDGYNVYLRGTDNENGLYLTWQTVLEKDVVLSLEWQDLKLKNRALASNFTSDQIDKTFQGKLEFFF